MPTATPVKVVRDTRDATDRFHQVLYRLDPPYELPDESPIEYVVVSGVMRYLPELAGMMGNAAHVHEAMAFRSDADGAIDNWSELACERNTIEHAGVLLDMGYTLMAPQEA